MSEVLFDVTLGFEDDGYPQVYLGKSVTVCHGWFFPDIDEYGGEAEEPVWYLETHVTAKGETMTVLNTFGIVFDFDTPLLDYIWPPASSTHTIRELIEMGIEVPT